MLALNRSPGIKLELRFQRRRVSKISLWKSDKAPLRRPLWPGDHNLNKLGRDQLGDVTCQISNICALRFQRRRRLNNLLTPHGRTDAQRRTNRCHKSSHWHFVPGELKSEASIQSRVKTNTNNIFGNNANICPYVNIFWNKIHTLFKRQGICKQFRHVRHRHRI